MELTNVGFEEMRLQRLPRKQFGTSPPLLPPTFADELAARSIEDDDLYNPRTAYLLSIVSGWAYSDKPTLERELTFYGIPNANVEEVRVENPAMLTVSTAYFIRSQSGRTGILAFRGTEPANAINWLTDFDVTMREFGYGRVHAGFYANVQVAWADIQGYLEKATSADGRANGSSGTSPLEALYITGHSLGAAMAVIAAARLVLEGAEWKRILRGVYTYGQPMVGDRVFRDYCEREFASKLFRHVFRRDLVCRMPPRLYGDFVHFGEERFSADPGSPWICMGRASKKTMAPRYVIPTVAGAALAFWLRRVRIKSPLPLLSTPRHDGVLPSLDDHSPTNYIQVSRSTLVQL